MYSPTRMRPLGRESFVSHMSLRISCREPLYAQNLDERGIMRGYDNHGADQLRRWDLYSLSAQVGLHA